MANLLLIRDLADKEGITLREIAGRVGIGESALQTLIRKGTTNTTTLEKIAKALGVSASYFFDDESVQQIGSITQNGNVTGKEKVCGHTVVAGECPVAAKKKAERTEKEIEHLKSLLVEKDARLADKDKMIELLTKQIK